MIKTPRTQQVMEKQRAAQVKLAKHFNSPLLDRITAGSAYKNSLFGCPIKGCRYCQRLSNHRTEKLALKEADSYDDYYDYLTGFSSAW